MTAAPIHYLNERVLLDPGAAAFWPARRVMAIADIHFEKASGYAERGSLVPPFDSRMSLERLMRLVRLYRPATLVMLGDAWHDRGATARMPAAERERLTAISREAELIWIAGNHDPAHDEKLPGRGVAEWRTGPFVFRHAAQATLGLREVEVSGHFHPKATIETRGKRVTRPAFVTDERRLMLPAFGPYSGGLDARDPAVARFFPRGARVFLLGQERLFSFTLAQVRGMEVA